MPKRSSLLAMVVLGTITMSQLVSPGLWAFTWLVVPLNRPSTAMSEYAKPLVK